MLQSCPYGYKSDGFVCLPCTEPMPIYSILYIVFLFCLVFALHNIMIQVFVPTLVQKSIFTIFSMIELVIASLLAVITVAPNFNVQSCTIESITDFYPSLIPRLRDTATCDNEAAFPLVSMVFYYIIYSMALFGLLRLPLYCILQRTKLETQFWYSPILTIYPIYAGVYFLFSGVLYYAWPYLALLVVFVLDVLHCSIFFSSSDVMSMPQHILALVGRLFFSILAAAGVIAFFLPWHMTGWLFFAALGAPLICGPWVACCSCCICWIRRNGYEDK